MVGFAPALVLLMIMLPLRGTVPFLDSWRFVGQYENWVEGQYGWEAFFAPHYDHPCAVGKAIYFAVLHWLHGAVGFLPLLSWGFSAVIAACVCLLARPLWAGRPVRGAVLMFCANLTIFSAAQGEVWIWDFLFQNFIPGVCLAAGIFVLSSGGLGKGRVVAAALLSVIAAFSFGSGFLVGMLLSVLIWDGMRDKGVARRWLATGVWFAFTIAVAWAALMSSPGVGTRLSVFLDRPGMRLQFILVLLGQMLGEGTMFEPQMLCAVMGGALVTVFIACMVFVFQRRHQREIVSASLPWIAFCLYGLANAALICAGRMQKSFNTALAERYGTFTLFFVFGTMFLAAVVMQHGDACSPFRRWVKRAVVPVLTLFIAAQVLNWDRGGQVMLLWNKRMEQDRARLAFMDVMPADPDWMTSRQTRPSTFRLAKALADQDRLRHVKLAPDKRMASFQRGGKVEKEYARFDKPVLLDDGLWKLGGIGGTSKTTAADLIVITAESAGGDEQIIALTAPQLPDTFFEREAQTRKHPEHFLAWSQTVARASLPKGRLTLRAYIFDQDKQLVRPMDGTHQVDALLESGRLFSHDASSVVGGSPGVVPKIID